MSVRNILVAFNGSDSSATALKYAISLSPKDAHITALLAHSTHELVNSRAAWVPASARKIIEEANADIIGEIEERFNTLWGGCDMGERLTFRRESGRVDTVLSEAARCFDLLVVGQDRVGDVDEHVTINPDRIALLSGRPVLIVPRGYDADAKHAHAALVWDGTRASARALSDSLGLLEDQGRVTVLTVGDDPAPRPVSELLAHLSRHGVSAEHLELSAEPGPARSILSYCAETDPGLLVMGAYEHSKFREDFLGGVTARILRGMKTPVMLSH